MKGVLDAGSTPATSTISILNWTQDQRRLKADWPPQSKLEIKNTFDGGDMVSTGQQVRIWTTR